MAPFLRLLAAAQRILPGSYRHPYNVQDPLISYDPEEPTDTTFLEPRLGAVASESKICSCIGASMLQCGGNAVDAAVATTFCVGVVGMYHSGIGGGGFALVRKANVSEYDAIDFRETAPSGLPREAFDDDYMRSLFSGLASGVPGEVRGMYLMHTRHGSMKWKDLIMPSVRLARNGWHLGRDWDRYSGNQTLGHDSVDMTRKENFLVSDPTWAKDFAPKGELLKAGELVTRKRYARTLETIANDGPDAFYTGDIAKNIVHTLKQAGGVMTLEDVAKYKPVIRKPVKIDYRGYSLTSTSAPSAGAVTLSILKIVEGFKDIGWPERTDLSYHRLVEAMRFSFGMVRRTVASTRALG
jgi:gamma-glutamyltranspeptidase/glutathione hydrolase